MRKALLIGTGTFDNNAIRPLDGVAVDVKVVGEVLEELGDCEQVVCLHADSEKVKAACETFFQSLAAEDHFVVYFAGHGYQTVNGWCFACRNTDLERLAFTTLSYEELMVARNGTNAAGLLVFDTCYGGSIDDNTRGNPQQPQPPPTRLGTALLWASYSWQTTADTPKGGVFTQALVEVARRGTRADTVKISPHELAELVQEELRHRGARADAHFHIDGSFPEEAYVIRNPSYVPPSLRGTPEHRSARLRRQAERLRNSRPPLRKHSSRPHVYFDPDTEREYFFIRATATDHVLAALRPAVLVPALMMLILSWLESAGGITSLVLSPIVVIGVIAGIIMGLHTARAPWFVLVTDDGVAYFRGATEIEYHAWHADKQFSEFHNVGPFSLRHIDVGKIHISQQAPFNLATIKRALTEWSENRRVREPGTSGDAWLVRRALLISVGAYNELQWIPSARDDLALARASLGALEHRELLDPSKQAVDNELTWLFTGEVGVVAIYFSGHGMVLNDRLHLALPPYTRATALRTSISIARIREMVAQSKVRHCVVVLDCCHAGISLDAVFDVARGPIDLARWRSERMSIMAATAARGATLTDGTAYSATGGSFFTETMVKVVERRRAGYRYTTLQTLCQEMLDETARLRIESAPELWNELPSFAVSGVGLKVRFPNLAAFDADHRAQAEREQRRDESVQRMTELLKQLRAKYDQRRLAPSCDPDSYELIARLRYRRTVKRGTLLRFMIFIGATAAGLAFVSEIAALTACLVLGLMFLFVYIPFGSSAEDELLIVVNRDGIGVERRDDRYVIAASEIVRCIVEPGRISATTNTPAAETETLVVSTPSDERKLVTSEVGNDQAVWGYSLDDIAAAVNRIREAVDLETRLKTELRPRLAKI